MTVADRDSQYFLYRCMHKYNCITAYIKKKGLAYSIFSNKRWASTIAANIASNIAL